MNNISINQTMLNNSVAAAAVACLPMNMTHAPSSNLLSAQPVTSTPAATAAGAAPIQSVMEILFREGMLVDNANGLATATSAESPQWKQWVHPELSENEIAVTEIKPFLFDETHALIWYKNTNLPTIQLRVAENSKYLSQSSQLHNGINLPGLSSVSSSAAGSQLSCSLVCISVDNLEGMTTGSGAAASSTTPTGEQRWTQHPLEGEAITQKISFNHNPIVFQRIKCKETSYNLKGLRFFVVCFVWSEASKVPVMIHVSLSLHIESRKKSLQESQTPLGFSHPFMPETLARNYERYSAVVNGDTQDSFFEYYSSCSIRHKILHPLFLFLKFPKSIRLYVDSSISQNATNYASLFLEIQRAMYTFMRQKKSENGRSRTTPIIGMELVVKNTNDMSKKSEKKEQMKVYHFVKPLIKEGMIVIYLDRKEISSSMGEVGYQDRMREDYKSIFSELLELKKVAEAQMDSYPNQQRKDDCSSSDNQDIDAAAGSLPATTATNDHFMLQRRMLSNNSQQQQQQQLNNSNHYLTAPTGALTVTAQSSDNNSSTATKSHKNGSKKSEYDLITPIKRKSEQSDRTTTENNNNNNYMFQMMNGDRITKKFHAVAAAEDHTLCDASFNNATSNTLMQSHSNFPTSSNTTSSINPSSQNHSNNNNNNNAALLHLQHQLLNGSQSPNIMNTSLGLNLAASNAMNANLLNSGSHLILNNNNNNNNVSTNPNVAVMLNNQLLAPQLQLQMPMQMPIQLAQNVAAAAQNQNPLMMLMLQNQQQQQQQQQAQQSQQQQQPQPQLLQQQQLNSNAAAAAVAAAQLRQRMSVNPAAAAAQFAYLQNPQAAIQQHGNHPHAPMFHHQISPQQMQFLQMQNAAPTFNYSNMFYPQQLMFQQSPQVSVSGQQQNNGFFAQHPQDLLQFQNHFNQLKQQ